MGKDPPRSDRRWRPQRKDILFIVGIVGIALEETRAFGPPSETLLIVFAAMVGLPIVLRADEMRTNGSANGPGSSAGRRGK